MQRCRTIWGRHSHRVNTQRQLPLSGIHSIMMDKLAQPGVSRGCTARPPSFTISTITYVQVLVYAIAERADTLPLFILYLYMYSVADTLPLFLLYPYMYSVGNPHIIRPPPAPSVLYRKYVVPLRSSPYIYLLSCKHLLNLLCNI